MQQIQQLFENYLFVPFRYTQEHHLSLEWTAAIVGGGFFIEVGAAYLIFLLIKTTFLQRRTLIAFILRRFGVGKRDIPYTFLQLTFPTSTTKSAYATEQLHILMRDLVKYRSFWEKHAGRKQPYSLELVATEVDGIRYIIKIPRDGVDSTRRTLLSFLPGIKVRKTEDYLSELSQTSIGVVELALEGDFVLPLADNKTLAEHDPIAFLAGHMRSLTKDELISFQIVVSSCSV